MFVDLGGGKIGEKKRIDIGNGESKKKNFLHFVTIW